MYSFSEFNRSSGHVFEVEDFPKGVASHNPTSFDSLFRYTKDFVLIHPRSRSKTIDSLTGILFNVENRSYQFSLSYEYPKFLVLPWDPQFGILEFDKYCQFSVPNCFNRLCVTCFVIFTILCDLMLFLTGNIWKLDKHHYIRQYYAVTNLKRNICSSQTTTVFRLAKHIDSNITIVLRLNRYSKQTYLPIRPGSDFPGIDFSNVQFQSIRHFWATCIEVV